MSQLETLFEDKTALFTLPEVYFRIRKILDDPLSGMPEVAKAVQLDPALSTQFLQIANSPLYRSSSEITTIDRAVAVLGTQLVHDVVLAAAVATAFQEVPREVIDVGSFWHTAVKRGVYAQVVASEIGVLDAEHVFIEGLVSQIGVMVLLQKMPKKLVPIVSFANEKQLPLNIVEKQGLGFDHAEVGARLLALWQLPETLISVVRHQYQPADADHCALETALVNIAGTLAMREHNAAIPFDETALSITELSAEQLDELAAAASERFATVVNTFGGLLVRQAA